MNINKKIYKYVSKTIYFSKIYSFLNIVFNLILFFKEKSGKIILILDDNLLRLNIFSELPLHV